MPDHPARSPLRLLAPLALVVVAIAVVGVLLSSDSGGGDESGRPSAGRTTTAARTQPKRTRATRATYTVKTGDTLGGISEKTGVPIDRLQELNPNLDPQALVSGQKIKLRE
jgi:LysM repeat protein